MLSIHVARNHSREEVGSTLEHHSCSTHYSHQIMKYLLAAQTSESHELWEVRISEDPWSELIVWSSNVKMSEFHGMSQILEASQMARSRLML